MRLGRQGATELAYLLLWATERGSWTVASPTDLARLRVAFRRVVEAGDHEMREAVERLDRLYQQA